MDARITKQRLGNMLSYDWLKILGAIALAAVFFCVFFMMIATRATDGQKFYVYVYNGLDTGGDFSLLEKNFKEKEVFAYDILDTGSETFSTSGIYGDTVFTARRSAGEGRVMFVSDVRSEENEDDSELLRFLDDKGTEREAFGLFLDPAVFLEDCKNYLTKFFGVSLSEKEPDDGATRAAFQERNGSDKRFRSSAKKEEGILDEKKRLKKLKDDYLSVSEAIGKKIDYVTYETEQKTHVVGFSMKSLNLTPLVYYTAEEEGKEVKKNDDIALCIFNNGTREGDLKYESVNFIAYLLREYGAAQ